MSDFRGKRAEIGVYDDACDMKERYYSLSLLRGLAYDDDVNGKCDGMIDFTVIDSISGADVEKVRHGEWVVYNIGIFGSNYKCSECDNRAGEDNSGCFSILTNYCHECGAKMGGGEEYV